MTFCSLWRVILVCQILIKNGAKVNVRNDQDETPLHFASTKGHAKAVKVIFEALFELSFVLLDRFL